jgi:hypothetical protein
MLMALILQCINQIYFNSHEFWGNAHTLNYMLYLMRCNFRKRTSKGNLRMFSKQPLETGQLHITGANKRYKIRRKSGGDRNWYLGRPLVVANWRKFCNITLAQPSRRDYPKPSSVARTWSTKLWNSKAKRMENHTSMKQGAPHNATLLQRTLHQVGAFVNLFVCSWLGE